MFWLKYLGLIGGKMKNLIIVMFLIASASAMAGEEVTQAKSYSAKFHKRIKEDRKNVNGCSYIRKDYGDEIVISVKADGTGRWVSFGIAADKLPLQDGDSFIDENITVDRKITYKDGVLSVDYIKVEDLKYYFTDLMKVEVDGYLSNVKKAEGNKAMHGKNFWGKPKADSLWKIKCKF